jgi:hypothetical protein
MPAILDVAIGTVFVFLLFSLIVSAATEIILTGLDQRARFLQIGLKEILCHGRHGKDHFDETTCAWVQQLCEHGVVNALSLTKKGQSHPSYIPPAAFRVALFDLIRRKWTKSAESPETIELRPLDLGNLVAAIRGLPEESKLRESLLAFHDCETHDLKTFERTVEGWFSATMERVSGWYKKRAQRWLLALGFVLAVAINVDTIRIVRSLSTDPNLREAIVAQAVAYNSEPRASISTATSEGTPPGVVEKIEAFKDDVTRLGGLGIPLGWNLSDQPQAPWDYLLILLGWCITATAASYGAPFWFDTLNRFINIRNAGKVPSTRPEIDLADNSATGQPTG